MKNNCEGQVDLELLPFIAECVTNIENQLNPAVFRFKVKTTEASKSCRAGNVRLPRVYYFLTCLLLLLLMPCESQPGS